VAKEETTAAARTGAHLARAAPVVLLIARLAVITSGKSR
jgi:hypothetical protein